MAAQLWKADEGEPSRLFLTASYVTLFIGGVVAGVVGAFMLPRAAGSAFAAVVPAGNGGGATRVVAAGGGAGLGQLLSIGVLIAVVGNPALSFAGLRTAGTRLAAFTPMVGWLLVVLPMLYTTSDGDEILPSGALRSVAFLLLGILGFMGVATVGRPTRGASRAVPAKSAPSRTAPQARKRR